jgi:PAS domain S-box-containing protein
MAAAIRVLYVDDESSLLDLAKVYLEHSGDFTVTTATSAPEAIQLLEKERFDVIVSDYQMPYMDGIEFLKHLKAKGNTTPFIIFTGKGREEVVIAALNAGADFYLQKGGESKAQFAELSHKIKKAIEGRHAEEAFKGSEERFRNLFDSALDMIQIIRPDGSFLHVNPAWKNTLGYSDEDVRTMAVFDIFHPDSLAHCSSTFRELLSGAEAPNMKAQFLTKDKKTISVEGNCTPEQKDGTVVSIRGIFHDITERKKTEDALRETSARLTFALRSAKAGTWDWDFATGKLGWSPEFFILFGLPPEAPPSFETWLSTLHPEDRTPAMDKIDQSVKEHKDLWNEYRILLPSGGLRWIGAAGSTSYTDSGEPLRMSGVCIDITDRKQAEEALRESDSILRSFFDSSGVMRGIVEVIADDDIRHIADNAVTANFIGLTPDDMKNKCGSELGEPRDILRRWVSYYRESQRSGKPVVFEYLDRRGDADAWLQATVSYLNTPPQGFPRFAYVVLDITESKISEETLHQSEEKYRTLFQTMAQGVVYQSSDGKIISANPAAERILGLSLDQMQGRTSIDPRWKAIHEDGTEYPGETHPSMTALQTGRETRGVMGIFNPADEKYHWILIDAIPQFIEEQKMPFQVVTTFDDITDLKQAGKALRESEEEYRSLFKNLLEGFAYCRMLYDEKWRPTDFILLNVNPAFDRILGTTTVTGKRSTEVFPGIKEAFPEVFEIYGRVAMTGEPESFDLDFVPSKKWLHISVYSPAKEHFVAIFEDITDSKQAEEALRESERRLRLALSIAHMGYWKYDVVSGTLAEYEDHGLLFGVPPDGRRWTLADVQPLVHPDDRAASEMALKRTMAEGVPFDSTYRTVMPDGEIRWLHSIGHLYRNSSGKPDHVFGVTQDITERKNAAMQIALANHKLALMNDVTYQDIQNKVTALRGYAEIFKDVRTETERASFIGKAEKILADIHLVIRNTKEYQEMGIDQPRWIPIEPAIRMAAALTSHDTAVSINTDLDGLELYTDPLIGKVFFQLVDNAIKHGTGITRITFSSREIPEGLVLTCEDDGTGIDPYKRATLFSRITGDKPRFGLFFVSEYLALAGMCITETSTPGKGARFEITVPKGAYRFSGGEHK